MPATRPIPYGLLDMLVGDGLITPSDAIGIRNRIRESWMPLGEVLRQQGLLTTTQLMDLVQMQACEPHFRLGELAVREGLCTEQDIVEAMELQRESNPHALELLLESPDCDRDRLWRVVVRYVRQIESRMADMPVQV